MIWKSFCLMFLADYLIILLKGATKPYFTHYSSVAILLFKRVYLGLHFLPIFFWKTSFSSFCACRVFCFKLSILNQCFNQGTLYNKLKLPCFNTSYDYVKLDSHLLKKFLCFNNRPSKIMKNYFILKARFVFKIFKFLFWLFGHVEKTAWLER